MRLQFNPVSDTVVARTRIPKSVYGIRRDPGYIALLRVLLNLQAEQMTNPTLAQLEQYLHEFIEYIDGGLAELTDQAGPWLIDQIKRWCLGDDASFDGDVRTIFETIANAWARREGIIGVTLDPSVDLSECDPCTLTDAQRRIALTWSRDSNLSIEACSRQLKRIFAYIDGQITAQQFKAITGYNVGGWCYDSVPLRKLELDELSGRQLRAAQRFAQGSRMSVRQCCTHLRRIFAYIEGRIDEVEFEELTGYAPHADWMHSRKTALHKPQKP